MALDRAIFDTSIYVYFLNIKSVDLENIISGLLCNKILMPSQIAEELERRASKYPECSKRINKWISNSHNNRNHFEYCARYDSFTYELIKANLDDGESGALAQANKVGVSWFFSDDVKNDSYIKENYRNIRRHSIFFLIALADILELLPCYKKVLIDFLNIKEYSKMTNSKKKILKSYIRKDYEAALKFLSINYDGNLIEKKCSIERILRE